MHACFVVVKTTKDPPPPPCTKHGTGDQQKLVNGIIYDPTDTSRYEQQECAQNVHYTQHDTTQVKYTENKNDEYEL